MSMALARPERDEFLEVVRARRRFLVLNVVATTLVALVVSLLLPKWYAARAVLLPPSEDDAASALSAIMPRSLGAVRLPGAPTTGDVFVAVLKSRSVADRLVSRFDLVRRYRARDQEQAVKELASHVTFHLGDEGTIAIVVEDQDPKIAAAMANG